MYQPTDDYADLEWIQAVYWSITEAGPVGPKLNPDPDPVDWVGLQACADVFGAIGAKPAITPDEFKVLLVELGFEPETKQKDALGQTVAALFGSYVH